MSERVRSTQDAFAKLRSIGRMNEGNQRRDAALVYGAQDHVTVFGNADPNLTWPASATFADGLYGVDQNFVAHLLACL